MKGFVVYRSPNGWFHWTTAEWWDMSPHHKAKGREEYQRTLDLNEAKDIRHAYNMMCNGMPTDNPMFNAQLEQKEKANER